MTAFFFGELRACRRSWISLGLMVLVAASLLSLSLGMVIAGSQASSDDVLEEYVTLGGMQLAFTVISILAMLPPLTATAIRVDSPRIARWQLVGSTVRQSMGLYFAMLLTVATAGSALGLALAFLAWPGFARLLVCVHLPAIAALSRPLSSLALILGLVTTMVAVGLAGLIALGSLKKVDPIAAVREQSGFRIRRVNPARLVLGILLLAGLLGGYFAISRMKPMADPQVLSGLLAAYWGGEGLGLIVVNLLLSPLLAPLFVHLVSAFLSSRFPSQVFGPFPGAIDDGIGGPRRRHRRHHRFHHGDGQADPADFVGAGDSLQRYPNQPERADTVGIRLPPDPRHLLRHSGHWSSKIDRRGPASFGGGADPVFGPLQHHRSLGLQPWLDPSLPIRFGHQRLPDGGSLELGPYSFRSVRGDRLVVFACSGSQFLLFGPDLGLDHSGPGWT